MSNLTFYEPTSSIASSATEISDQIMQGGQDEAFPDLITCRLCSEVFLDPFVFACGHTFCQSCGDKWRTNNSKCPENGCNKFIGLPVPNLLIKEATISYHAQKAKQQEMMENLLEAAARQQQQQYISQHRQLEEAQKPWSGDREVGVRKSYRHIPSSTNKGDQIQRNGLSAEAPYTKRKKDAAMPVIVEMSPCQSTNKPGICASTNGTSAEEGNIGCRQILQRDIASARPVFMPPNFEASKLRSDASHKSGLVRGAIERRTECLPQMFSRQKDTRMSFDPKSSRSKAIDHDYDQLFCTGLPGEGEEHSLSQYPYNHPMGAEKKKVSFLKRLFSFNTKKSKK